jgi:hypothetical protein
LTSYRERKRPDIQKSDQYDVDARCSRDNIRTMKMHLATTVYRCAKNRRNPLQSITGAKKKTKYDYQFSEAKYSNRTNSKNQNHS